MGLTKEQETVRLRAEENFEKWTRVYGALKKLLQEATDEQFEEYIEITIAESNVEDEVELRRLYSEIRNEKEGDNDEKK